MIVDCRLDDQLVSARTYVAGEGEGIAGSLKGFTIEEKGVLIWLERTSEWAMEWILMR